MNNYLDKAFVAIGEYLTSCGWKSDWNLELEPMFFWIDPLTGQKHRLDFAFFIETEREIGKVNTKPSKMEWTYRNKKTGEEITLNHIDSSYWTEDWETVG